MFRSNRLDLCIGFQCVPSRPDPERAEFRFLRILQQFAGSAPVPVHWFIPPMLFETPGDTSYDDLVRIIRERMESRDDLLVATGYRGAFHPLLTYREIEKDLRWALRDPWGGGIQQFFQRPVRAVFPYHPDFSRRPIAALYRTAGFRYVAMRYRPGGGRPYHLLWKHPESGLVFFQMLTTAAVSAGHMPRPRGHGEHTGAFLFFTEEDLSAGTIPGLFRRLSKKYALSFHSLEKSAASPLVTNADTLRELATSHVPCTPAARSTWLEVEGFRRTTHTTKIRAALSALSFREGALSPPAGDGAFPGPPVRELSASMPGHVTLGGDGLLVGLDAGRLSSFSRRGERSFPLLPVESYLTDPAGRHPFSLESAFSFEGDDLQGMRAMMSFMSSGELVIDYYFLRRFPSLIVDVTVSYPTLAPSPSRGIRELVPFLLPVRSRAGAKEFEITSVYADGTLVSHAAPVAGGVATICGNRFSIRSGDQTLCIFFPRSGALTHRGLQCKRLSARSWKPPASAGRSRQKARAEGESVFGINLLGTFFPAEVPSHSGITEQLTFFLGRGPCGAEPPRVPAAVARRALAHRVIGRQGEAGA